MKLQEQFAGVCLLAALAANAIAQESRPWNLPRKGKPLFERTTPAHSPDYDPQALRAAFAAWEIEDSAPLQSMAKDARVDPYLAALWILGVILDTKTSGANAARWRAFLVDFARAAEPTPAGQGLDKLVGAWLAFGTDELRREQRLMGSFRSLQLATSRADPDAISLEVERTQGARKRTTKSLSAWLILHNAVDRLLDLGVEESCATLAEEAVERARVLGHLWGLVRSLELLSTVRVRMGQHAAALPCLKESVAVREKLGAPAHQVLSAYGTCLCAAGKAREGLDQFMAAAELLQQEGDVPGRAKMLTSAAVAAGSIPDAAVEDRLLAEALAVASAHQNPATVAEVRITCIDVAIGRSDFGKAVGEADALVALVDKIESAEVVAKSLLKVAIAKRRAGDYGSAAVTIARARAIPMDAVNPRTAAEILNQEGIVHHLQGREREAEACFAAVAQAWKQMGDDDQAKISEENRVPPLIAIGEFAKAEQILGAALAEAERERDASRAESALERLVPIALAIGDIERARQLCERRIDLAKLSGFEHAVVDGLTMLTRIDLEQGSFGTALNRAQQTLERAKQTGDLNLVAALRNDIAAALGGIGSPEQALAEFRAVEEEARVRGDARAVSTSLRNQARVQMVSGAFGPALATLERISRGTQQNESACDAAELGANRAEVLTELGRYTEARKLFETAIPVFEAGGMKRELAFAQLDFASLELLCGNLEQARYWLDRATKLAPEIGDLSLAMSCANLEARWQTSAGRPDLALAATRRALEVELSVCRGLGASDLSTFAGEVRESSSQALTAALAARRMRLFEPRHHEVLLFAFEASRALALGQGLANPRSAALPRIPRALRDEEAIARSDLESRRRALSYLSKSSATTPEELTAGKASLRRAYSVLEEIIVRIERSVGEVADLVRPLPASLERIRAALPASSALVWFQIDEARAAALVLRGTVLELVDLGPSPPIRELVQRWQRLLSVAGTDEEALAREAWQLLWQPLTTHLGSAAQVVISPDGPLAFVPFEALCDDGGSRLVSKYSLSLVPSATVLVSLSERAARPVGRGLLALGDPTYSIAAASMPESSGSNPFVSVLRPGGLDAPKALPGTRIEVESLRRLFGAPDTRLLLGNAATRHNLLTELLASDHRLFALHLACHGHVDTERPRLSGLSLAGNDILSLDDILRSRADIDLVVLSACDTGRGKLLRGEGVFGLVRAFLFAGADRVVVSNWRVPDQWTKDLMIDFYEGMLQRGLSPPAALREAKLRCLAAKGAAADPANWAGFVLWGLAK